MTYSFLEINLLVFINIFQSEAYRAISFVSPFILLIVCIVWKFRKSSCKTTIENNEDSKSASQETESSNNEPKLLDEQNVKIAKLKKKLDNATSLISKLNKEVRAARQINGQLPKKKTDESEVIRQKNEEIFALKKKLSRLEEAYKQWYCGDLTRKRPIPSSDSPNDTLDMALDEADSLRNAILKLKDNTTFPEMKKEMVTLVRRVEWLLKEKEKMEEKLKSYGFLETKYASMSDKYDHEHQRAEELASQNRHLSSKLKIAEESVQKSNGYSIDSNSELIEQIQKLQNSLNNEKKTSVSTKDDLNKAMLRIDSLVKTIEEKNSKIEMAQKDKNDIQQSHSDMERKFRSLNRQIEVLTMQLHHKNSILRKDVKDANYSNVFIPENIISDLLKEAKNTGAAYLRITKKNGYQTILNSDGLSIEKNKLKGVCFITKSDCISPDIYCEDVVDIEPIANIYTGDVWTRGEEAIKLNRLVIEANKLGMPLFVKRINEIGKEESFIISSYSISTGIFTSSLGGECFRKSNNTKIIYARGRRSFDESIVTFALDKKISEVKVLDCKYCFEVQNVYSDSLAEILQNEYDKDFFYKTDNLLALMPLYEKNLPSTIKSRAHLEVFDGYIEDAICLYRKFGDDVYVPSLGMNWKDACIADINHYISCIKDSDIKKRFISIKQKLDL